MVKARLQAARRDDSTSRMRALRGDVDKQSRRLANALDALAPWGGGLGDLAFVSVPGEAETQALRSACRGREALRRQACAERLAAKTGEAERLRAEAEAAARAADLVGDDLAADIRAAREALWSAHRAELERAKRGGFRGRDAARRRRGRSAPCECARTCGSARARDDPRWHRSRSCARQGGSGCRGQGDRLEAVNREIASDRRPRCLQAARTAYARLYRRLACQAGRSAVGDRGLDEIKDARRSQIEDEAAVEARANALSEACTSRRRARSGRFGRGPHRGRGSGDRRRGEAHGPAPEGGRAPRRRRSRRGQIQKRLASGLKLARSVARGLRRDMAWRSRRRAPGRRGETVAEGAGRTARDPERVHGPRRPHRQDGARQVSLRRRGDWGRRGAEALATFGDEVRERADAAEARVASARRTRGAARRRPRLWTAPAGGLPRSPRRSTSTRGRLWR